MTARDQGFSQSHRHFAKAGTEVSGPLTGVSGLVEVPMDAIEEIPQELLVSREDEPGSTGVMSFLAFLVLIASGVSALGAYTPDTWWQGHPALSQVHATIKASNHRVAQALGLRDKEPSVREVSTRPSAVEVAVVPQPSTPAPSQDAAPATAPSPAATAQAPVQAEALELDARVKARRGKRVGRLTSEALGSVLEGLASGVKQCWREDESELSSARAVFNVAKNGKAKAVRVKVRGGGHKADQCLTSLIRTTRFPSAKRGTRSVTYEWKVRGEDSAAAPRSDDTRPM